MEPNSYQPSPTVPTTLVSGFLRCRANLIALAIGLPVALYVAGYFYSNIAPGYGIQGDSGGTTRLYRWWVEAIVYSPAGNVESVLTGKPVNVELAAVAERLLWQGFFGREYNRAMRSFTFVCFDCRTSYRANPQGKRVCSQCSRECYCLPKKWRIPKKDAVKEWADLRAWYWREIPSGKLGE